MTPITSDDGPVGEVAGGVDTHAAAVLAPVGRVLGTEEFPATPAGYAALLDGRSERVGVEGTVSTAPRSPACCTGRTSR